MNRLRICGGWLLLILAGWLVGCNDFDSYSTNPNHRLRSSADTLSFDTVFTAVGSATKQLLIYNPNNEHLRIGTIELASGGKSGFSINVDGRKGTSFSNIELWKNDSLYLLVEVTVDPNGQHQPVIVEDAIHLTVNGNRMSVVLRAYGQDVHVIKGGVAYRNDTILTADRPYLIYDSITIGKGATVTVEPGATFYMYDRAKWIVDGTIKTIGRPDAPITFRGHRLDTFREDTLHVPYDRLPGLWDGIRFTAASFDNTMEHTIVRNTTNGIVCDPSDPEKPKITFANCQLTNSIQPILQAVDCRIAATGSEFSNAKGGVLYLIGGHHTFIHCTMANYFRFNVDAQTEFTSHCLTLGNRRIVVGNDKKETRTQHPLKQAYFDNCIIDGNKSADSTLLYQGEVQWLPADTAMRSGDDATFNYRFRACFVKTARMNSHARFVNCLFIKSPEYLKNGTAETAYAFDFRLKNNSVGIGKADRTVAEQYPTDRYGVSRLASATAPTIGAYEHVHQPDPKSSK